ncbi:biotin--[acetyl-CoA-carboxylase] ligase [Ruficoccus sp. ZRK36]|uniref:biotin--[acetyl-CoA-carboxylase] ligase n=1 Tax=Ruficoccus sp. ZRK36 TaxID=2866311 RepID=UPI001C73D4A4|nr:biotin--[acetyl-CoA-carboxylase] ligase [Ruficoccus sp. ZRK36]QYY36797.1 biotin--[acetyl-CoA-carboxylase] ligase [Ruficoccus sp. ZRK36]
MGEVSDAEILAAFLAADGDYVSGSSIAEDTGVSRAAVWGRLDRLRTEGFSFEAVRNKGYRLETIPEVLHPALLAAHLLRLACPANLHFLAETDSTNSEAERLLAQGEHTPFVVVAGKQTAGRGRRGRAWFSENAGNLTLSLALRPQLPPARMQTFTLWMGLSTCMAVNDLCGVSLKVKWPNDLHWDGKKVAGMLTEARSDSEMLRDLVFGIGLNINSVTDQFPEEVRPLASSLREAAGKVFDLNATAAKIIVALQKACDDFLEDRYRETFREEWPKFDALVGRTVTVSLTDGDISGEYLGIDETGTLRLRLPDGVEQRFAAGDVTLRKQK